MTKFVAFVLAFVLCASTSFAHTLTVPFFKDDAPAVGGSEGYISVSNTTTNVITMNVVYIQDDLNGEAVVQPAAEFLLSPRQAVSWRPVGDTLNEGKGRDVPNVLDGFGAEGSAQIIWLASEGGPGALIGRYSEQTNSRAFAYILLGE